MAYVNVYIDLREFSTSELIEEVNDRGYLTIKEGEKIPIDDAVWDLWLSWQHDKDDFFEKKLKDFFSEQLNINVL